MPVLSSVEGARKLNRRQTRENAAFLKVLAQTGNARLAARELGVNRSTYTKRRAKHPEFAAAWDEALEVAQVALLPSRGRGGPGEGLLSHSSKPMSRSSRAQSRGVRDDSVPAPLDWACPERLPQAGSRRARDERIPSNLKTKGGEQTITRLATGRLQLRRAQPGRITRAAEQVFFTALAETANIRLAAAEAGFAHTSFLARARKDPAFAHEMRTLMTIAADRLVWAQCERATRPMEDYDFNPDIPIPPMSVEQAILQLIYHRPDGPFQMSRRRNPPPPFEKVAPRIRAKVSAIKRHSHFEKTGTWRYDHEAPERSEVGAQRPLAAIGVAECRPARRET